MDMPPQETVPIIRRTFRIPRDLYARLEQLAVSNRRTVQAEGLVLWEVMLEGANNDSSPPETDRRAISPEEDLLCGMPQEQTALAVHLQKAQV